MTEYNKHKDEVLPEHQQMLSAIAVSSQDWIWALNLEGRHTYSNYAVEKILGFTPEEFQGMGLDFLHPEDRQTVDAMWPDCVKARKGWKNVVLRWRTKEGQYRYLESTAAPILDTEGELVGFCGVDRDITERKEAEEIASQREARLNAIVNGSPIPQFVIDRDHRVLHWNKALEQYSRIPAADMVGTNHHWKAFYPSERPCLADLLISRETDKIPQWYGDNWKPSRFVEGGYEAEGYFPHMGPEGVWLYFTVAPILDQHGDIFGAVETLEDITERKRAEESLRESEERYRQIAQCVPDLIWSADLSGRITYASPSVERIYRWTVEEFQKMAFQDLVSPEQAALDSEEIAAELMKAHQPGYDRNTIRFVERELFRKDRSTFWAEISLTFLWSDDGKPVGIIGMTRDITERKRAEQELRESEEKFSAVVNHAKDGIIMIQEKNLVFSNQAIADMLGYRREELEGTPYIDCVAPESRQLVASRVEARLRGETPPSVYEIKLLRRNGQVFDAELSAAVILYREKPTNVVVLRDISERKRAEEALRTSEATIRSVFRAAPVGICIMKNRLYQSANEYWCEQFGYPEPTILGKTTRMLYESDEEYERVGRELYSHLQESGLASIETRLRRSDGVFRQVILSAAPIRLDDLSGGVVVIIYDITERKRVEEALRTSEAQLSNALRMARAGHWEYNVATDTFTFNDNFYRIFRTTVEEVGGHTMSSAEYARRFCHPDDRHMVRKEIEAAIATDDPNYSRLLEHRILYANGEVGFIMARFFIVKDSKGRTVKSYGVNQDITERKRAEAEKEKLQAQLLQAQKMESVGRLAGGVAHDFNNMLNVIICNTEMAMDRVEPSGNIYMALQDVLQAGVRSADLTRQLLAFARKQVTAPKVLDLNDTVSGMLKMLRRIIGEDINLVWIPGNNLWSIKIDPSQIDQILANLTVNARDAIEKTGNITIQTSNMICDEAYCTGISDCIPGEYVILAVSDDGCGMGKEILANIFEPFFTTKKEGQGTGLGLATVYGIVKQNNGFINAYSEPKIGSTFKIYLPRHKAENLNIADKKEEIVAQRGTETILIVEDEDVVLNICRKMLEQLGYRVLSFTKPDEAIRQAKNYKERIDLLLTDVVMPEVNGKELLEQINSIKPGLKCLYMSGHTADVISQKGSLEEGVHFISKPFSFKNIAAKIREVLDQ